jgi:hypothetical protein
MNKHANQVINLIFNIAPVCSIMPSCLFVPSLLLLTNSALTIRETRISERVWLLLQAFVIVSREGFHTGDNI